MKQTERKIYLASKSPRRRELLHQIGVEFELLTLRTQLPRGPDVSEEIHEGEAAADYVARVTREKAAFAWQVLLARKLPLKLPLHPVLAADTTVVIDEKILGKPADMADAKAMLRLLSGRTHQVLTSVVVQSHDQVWQNTHTSEVTFANLPEAAIDAYCLTAEPYDKAGAYAIQGWAAMFIQHIAGSYSSIMGLPLFETAQLLRQAGIDL